MLDLDQRRARTEAVVARFRGRPFSWTGRRTCVHLARAQMRAFGHRPPAVPDIRNPRAARHALAMTGHMDLAALLDSMLPRIAPSAMWIGDLALMEGGDGLDAIVIGAGGKMLGYHSDQLATGLVTIVPLGQHPFIGAWRL